MTAPAQVRKAGLTLHVISSVGWLGAVLVYLALGVAAITSDDEALVAAVLAIYKPPGLTRRGQRLQHEAERARQAARTAPE